MKLLSSENSMHTLLDGWMDGWMDGLPIPRLVVAQCWGCLVSVDAPLHLVG